MGELSRIIKIFLFILGLILLLLLILRFGGCTQTSADLGNKQANPDIHTKQVFIVDNGENIKSIAMRLEANGLIDKHKDFIKYIKKEHLAQEIRGGTYNLSPSMTIEEIANKMIEPKGATRSFKIPSGSTLEDIAEIFSDEGVMTTNDFWEVVVNEPFPEYEFLKDQPKNTHRLEGYLYPDTYIYKQNTAPNEIIAMMIDRFIEVFNELPKKTTTLSDRDTVILASLIEKETFNDSEKPLIASVYINRLNEDLPLQCDATILYDLPYHRTLTFADYQYDSPYNTYLFTGFPPTAIANPGKASLVAAISPAKTDYKFYLLNTETNDRHVFAKTHDEHVKNREKYGYD